MCSQPCILQNITVIFRNAHPLNYRRQFLILFPKSLSISLSISFTAATVADRPPSEQRRPPSRLLRRALVPSPSCSHTLSLTDILSLSSDLLSLRRSPRQCCRHNQSANRRRQQLRLTASSVLMTSQTQRSSLRLLRTSSMCLPRPRIASSRAATPAYLLRVRGHPRLSLPPLQATSRPFISIALPPEAMWWLVVTS